MSKVLLIDDDTDFCTLFIEQHSRDFEFVRAKNFNEGIEKLSTDHPDAVLLDLTLPDSKSAKTVADFKRFCPRVALIVISGDSRPETKIQTIDDNAWGYIVKDQVLDFPSKAVIEINSAIEWKRRDNARDKGLK